MNFEYGLLDSLVGKWRFDISAAEEAPRHRLGEFYIAAPAIIGRSMAYRYEGTIEATNASDQFRIVFEDILRLSGHDGGLEPWEGQPVPFTLEATLRVRDGSLIGSIVAREPPQRGYYLAAHRIERPAR